MRKLIQKRYLILLVSVIVLCIVVITYKSQDIKTYASDQSKSSEKNLITSEKFNSKIKDYKTQDEINKNIKTKFKVKEPKYKYKNMKKVCDEGRTESNIVNSIDILLSWYKAEDNKEICIQQTQDTGRPSEILPQCKKIKMGNIDAYIYGNSPGDDFAQIMFWNDGMYYNVSGDIGVDELVKIAQSLQ